MSYQQPTSEEIRARIDRKKKQRKYHLPVVGHFADRSVLFDSILHASEVTGVQYTLIFEACIGKIYKAGNIVWEYQKGNHYIRYKAYYVNVQDKYTRYSTFNG